MAVLSLLNPSWPMLGEMCAEAKEAPVAAEFKKLEGRWVRPDGGYTLELRRIKKDGSLKATYFNPNPIKVFRSLIRQKEGKITLFVELKDVNYPGSRYYLKYDPETDRLRGTYFQAVEKRTFDVEFFRVQ